MIIPDSLAIEQHAHVGHRLSFCHFCRASSYASCRNFVCPSVCLLDCLCVRPSHTCFRTKPNNALRISWYHTKGQSL